MALYFPPFELTALRAEQWLVISSPQSGHTAFYKLLELECTMFSQINLHFPILSTVKFMDWTSRSTFVLPLAGLFFPYAQPLVCLDLTICQGTGWKWSPPALSQVSCPASASRAVLGASCIETVSLMQCSTALLHQNQYLESLHRYFFNHGQGLISQDLGSHTDSTHSDECTFQVH